MSVTVRWYAAAGEAAGRPEEQVAPGPLADLLAAAVARHGERLGRVVSVCSVLVDGTRVDRDAPVEVGPGSVVDVLPPFAGG